MAYTNKKYEDDFQERRGEMYADPRYDGKPLYRKGDKLWATERSLVYEVEVVAVTKPELVRSWNTKVPIPCYIVKFIGHNPKTELSNLQLYEWDLYDVNNMSAADILYCGDHNKLVMKESSKADLKGVIRTGLVRLTDQERRRLEEMVAEDEKFKGKKRRYDDDDRRPSFRDHRYDRKNQPKESVVKRGRAHSHVKPSAHRDRTGKPSTSRASPREGDHGRKRSRERTPYHGRAVLKRSEFRSFTRDHTPSHYHRDRDASHNTFDNRTPVPLPRSSGIKKSSDARKPASHSVRGAGDGPAKTQKKTSPKRKEKETSSGTLKPKETHPASPRTDVGTSSGNKELSVSNKRDADLPSTSRKSVSRHSHLSRNQSRDGKNKTVVKAPVKRSLRNRPKVNHIKKPAITKKKAPAKAPPKDKAKDNVREASPKPRLAEGTPKPARDHTPLPKEIHGTPSPKRTGTPARPRSNRGATGTLALKKGQKSQKSLKSLKNVAAKKIPQREAKKDTVARSQRTITAKQR